MRTICTSVVSSVLLLRGRRRLIVARSSSTTRGLETDRQAGGEAVVWAQVAGGLYDLLIAISSSDSHPIPCSTSVCCEAVYAVGLHRGLRLCARREEWEAGAGRWERLADDDGDGRIGKNRFESLVVGICRRGDAWRGERGVPPKDEEAIVGGSDGRGAEGSKGEKQKDEKARQSFTRGRLTRLLLSSRRTLLLPPRLALPQVPSRTSAPS